jgi:hypothetical protein
MVIFSKKLKTPSDNPPSRFPLPVEILRKIVGYVIRLEGHESVELEDPFSPHGVGEELPEIDPGIFYDRRSLGQVHSTLRAIVAEISSEYLVIRRAKELKHFIKLFEHSQLDGWGKRLGERTRRIDLKIIGRYSAKRVAALLQLTPNLLIFVHQSNRHHKDFGRINKELIRGLMTFGRNVRRLDFDSIGEAPALYDLIDISRFLPRLETLRLLCLHSYPTDPAAVRRLHIAHFKHLKTLALGPIPAPQSQTIPQHYIGVWDPLLRYLGLNTKQLPVLERFEPGILPEYDTTFFTTHGYKIRMLRVTTARTGTQLPVALNHCTNLESLVFAHGIAGADTLCTPTGHHTIKRICITPETERVTEVPAKVFMSAILSPLEELIERVEGMDLPEVEEVRVRDFGAYGQLVEHASLLNMWWRRFALKGIRFVDQEGKPYDNVVDREWCFYFLSPR